MLYLLIRIFYKNNTKYMSPIMTVYLFKFNKMEISNIEGNNFMLSY